MISRPLQAAAVLAMIATGPNSFAGGCGPSGCGSGGCMTGGCGMTEGCGSLGCMTGGCGTIGCGTVGCGMAACGMVGCGPCGGGGCQTGCSTCQSGCFDGCSMCGFGDGFGGEGIDIDSLTIDSKSKKLYESLQAQLVFIMPEDADLYLSNQRMTTPGDKRTFNIPVNDQKLTYKYEIKVDVVRGGKKYYKKQKIEILRAGAILEIAVVAPPAEEGEDPIIELAIVPKAPGGPPEGEEEEDGDDKGDGDDPAADEDDKQVAAR